MFLSAAAVGNPKGPFTKDVRQMGRGWGGFEISDGGGGWFVILSVTPPTSDYVCLPVQAPYMRHTCVGIRMYDPNGVGKSERGVTKWR